jgi:hypothetical protein
MQIRPSLLLLFSSSVMALCGVATAQSPTAKAPTVPPAETGCAASEAAPGQGTIASGETTGQSREPLGDKLARSDGVLCPPPGVDPEIRAPTPATGNTPVIPPPGSPGGDPSVRPK